MNKILWISGNSGSGKTTLGKLLVSESPRPVVWLDGDELRKIWTDLDLSEKSRREQNYRTARLATMMRDQGFYVIVTTICPYKDQRADIAKMTGCEFFYLKGGKEGIKYPYEPE